MSEALRPDPELEEELERAKHAAELRDFDKGGITKMQRMILELYGQDAGIEP